MAAPALRGPPAAVTPFDVEGEEVVQEVEGQEPMAKPQKLSTRRVGGEDLCHMDVDSYCENHARKTRTFFPVALEPKYPHEVRP